MAQSTNALSSGGRTFLAFVIGATTTLSMKNLIAELGPSAAEIVLRSDSPAFWGMAPRRRRTAGEALSRYSRHLVRGQYCRAATNIADVGAKCLVKEVMRKLLGILGLQILTFGRAQAKETCEQCTPAVECLSNGSGAQPQWARLAVVLFALALPLTLLLSRAILSRAQTICLECM